MTYQTEPGKVYIIGAGPGAPDLIAVRARDIIEQSDLILYADSLVEHSVADLATKPTANIVPSSGLHLQQMVDMMVEATRAGQVVARVHSGDPALYGATHEQMALLDDAHVSYEIVPGITAAFAAAAQLGVELTIPDVVQTIILTRTAGRTTMPVGEELKTLAAPGSSLAIYLSIARIKRVVEDLINSGGYTLETPVAVFHKVTWPDESHVVGTLATIAKQVRKAGYTKHALILVSPALDPELKGKKRRTSSHLYDKSYTHRFRKAADFKRGKERKEREANLTNTVDVQLGDKHLGAQRTGSVVIGITKNGAALAQSLAHQLDATASVPAKFAANGANVYANSVLNEIRRRWSQHEALILVMPTGVATRAIAPLLRDKLSDPAVVVVDEGGNFAIPLVGGHVGGANELAQKIGRIIQAQPVITTASDVQGKPAIDLLGREEGWRVADGSSLTHVAACLVNSESIGVLVDDDQAAPLADLLAQENVERVNTLDELDVDAFAAGIVVSERLWSDHHQHVLRKSVLFRPKTLTVGMGCKRGVSAEELRQALTTTLQDAGYSIDSVAKLATVDLKADEAGLLELAASLNLSLTIIDQLQLTPQQTALDPATLSPSAATEKLGLIGVAEPTALLASNGTLLAPKRSFANCTVAIAG